MSERLHVLALPHTQTNGEFATCAYTAKVEKFCRMMTGQERQLILYAPEGNTAPCDEFVPVVTLEQQRRWFGSPDHNDLDRGGFDWSETSAWWSESNSRTIGEICHRSGEQDLLLPIAGWAQKLVCDAVPWMTVAEYGVGYEGVIAGRRNCYAAYESHAHRHLVYGLNKWQNAVRQYDTVIPNYFDPADFPYVNQGGGDYLLFIGRLIRQKAPLTACQIADALGMPIKIAGPGATAWKDGDGFVEFPEGRCVAKQIEYVGPVGVEERAQLMAGAAATIVPTIYLEPFGGVAVESMMAGTPVVATDFGAFTETVREGVSGYRFQTLQEAVDGTVKAMDLDTQAVRQYALDHYSLDAVRPMYERWFDNLDGLWGEGWTALRDRQETSKGRGA